MCAWKSGAALPSSGRQLTAGREVTLTAPWSSGRNFQQTPPGGSTTVIQRRQQTKSVSAIDVWLSIARSCYQQQQSDRVDYFIISPYGSVGGYLVYCLWSPYVIGQTIIFSSCSFFLSSIFFYLLFSFPRLISAVGDWMSTILLHMAWP